MKFVLPVFLIILVIFTGCRLRKPDYPVFDEGELPSEVSSLIAELTAEATKEGRDVIVENWMSAQSGQIFPIVVDNHSVDTNNPSHTVTFLYYDKDSEAMKMSLVWELCDYNKEALPLHQVEGTDLYYLSLLVNDPFDITYYYAMFSSKDSSGVKRRDSFNRNIVYASAIKNIILPENSSSGYLQCLRDIQPVTDIYELKSRDIYVYLPPEYYANPGKTYPVFYMQDGQNLWDSSKANWGGWKMDTITTRMITNGEIEPIIIVGVENSQDGRSYEYVGFSTYYGTEIPEDASVDKDMAIGKNLAYEDFLVNEVKPLIDGMYRTKPERENTAIGGSSYGGGVSLSIAFKNPGVFGKVASLSGGNRGYDHNDFSNKPYYVFPYLIDNVISEGSDLKIYMDCGGQDLDAIFLDYTEMMKEALLKLDFTEGDNFYYYISEDEGHNEAAWANRAPLFLEYLFGVE